MQQTVLALYAHQTETQTAVLLLGTATCVVLLLSVLLLLLACVNRNDQLNSKTPAAGLLARTICTCYVHCSVNALLQWITTTADVLLLSLLQLQLLLSITYLRDSSVGVARARCFSSAAPAVPPLRKHPRRAFTSSGCVSCSQWPASSTATA
jgi:hypothetical protein